MRAIKIPRYGGPEVLEFAEHPKPEPGPNEVQVEIKATALNRADLLQREGKYPPPQGASPIPGLEMSGIVSATGQDVSSLSKGDRVAGLLAGGGYAEFTVLKEDHCIPIPTDMSFEAAAAIPEVGITAFQALYWLGKIDKDSRVLIHAGGSGVGTAAIQLAKGLGAQVITNSSSKKIQACLNLGADHALDRHEHSFEERVRDFTSGRGANIILDFACGPTFQGNLNALAIDGRLIILAIMGGYQADHINLLPFLSKRIQVIGTTLRSRTDEYKSRLIQDFIKNVQLIPSPLSSKNILSQKVPEPSRTGKQTYLRPVIHEVLPWEDVAEAHKIMGSNQNIGKIILTI